jgi:hypothetical protein
MSAIILEIMEEISRQAALEEHKRNNGATTGEIYQSRAASYRSIARMVYGSKSPILHWAAQDAVKEHLERIAMAKPRPSTSSAED